MPKRLTDAQRAVRRLRKLLEGGFEDELEAALAPSARTSHARSSGPATGRRGGFSDPTADTALADAARDPQADVAIALLDLIDKAGNACARLKFLRDPVASKPGRDPCVNCSRFGIDEPSAPGREGRCEACYRWRKRPNHGGEDAPRDVVLKRHGLA